jgi:hypothetical protein
MRIRFRALHLARTLAVLACALAVAGPAVRASAATDAGTAGYGWLRLAHLSPNTPAVDVYLYSFDDPRAMVVLKHVAYGTVSPYERVASGDYTVAMRGAGAAPDSKPVLSASVNVAAGNAYTVAGMGPFKALRLQVMHDRLSTPPGKALVRVIQASLRENRVTVTIGARRVASELKFANSTGYEAVSPGTWRVRAAGAGASWAGRATFAAGSIHTLVVLDDPGHLTIRVLEDAAGSAEVPAGAAATGLGGTAPQPGPPLLPWLSIAACGLLVAAAGLGRLRRPTQDPAAQDQAAQDQDQDEHQLSGARHPVAR